MAALRGEMQGVMRADQLGVLVFEVDGHRYGVAAERVREIVRAVMPLRLPAAPRVIIGVINVRGRTVPLIDLRARFHLNSRPLGVDEVFVIVDTGARVFAFRADRALEVVTVPRSELADIAESVPRASYLAGTVPLPGGLLLLVDVALFLDEAERATLDAALDDAQTENTVP